MGFYEQLSKYYDFIFPVGKEQLKFLKEAAGIPPKELLDIACGSGGYSLELAKAGYRMTAVDVDPEMVKLAEQKVRREGLAIEVRECDMLQLANGLTGQYHCVFCIGNSIVHLGSHGEILAALKQMHHLLADKGCLVLQIINFDRIINREIKALPTIKNDEIGLEFVRRYNYKKESGLINFDTMLTVSHQEGEERYENSIELFPLLCRQMEELLKASGFEHFHFYGDFNGSEYGEDSFLLVVKAVKHT